MNERQSTILSIVINEHIRTGLPVSSTVVASRHGLSISPATVRNDMADLEAEGYIIQPHTSSGRIPSEKGYREYLKSVKPKKLSRKESDEFSGLLNPESKGRYKDAAKLLSRRSGQAVFWAFHKYDLFYTGISNLFSQPEFSRLNAVYDISVVIDRVDEVISRVFDSLDNSTRIFIGSENPFGTFCGSIISKYPQKEGSGLVGLLGPIRMDYERNLGLIEHLVSKIGDDIMQ